MYGFLGTNTKSVYVFLGIYLTYPFLAQERGGGVLDGLKKKNLPRVISEIPGLPWTRMLVVDGSLCCQLG